MADNGIESALALTEKVHDAFCLKGIKLALAESCTGGYISHLLTSIPGASDFFTSCIVAYSEEAKRSILGIDSNIIKEHGAVSPQCAIAMATGAARAGGTEAALSVTGNLGPEPMEGKEVGRVYAAVYLRGRILARDFRFSGDRQSIKEKTAAAALEMLHEAVTTWD